MFYYIQKSSPNASTYIAAVVEYPPKTLTNINETLRVNSDAYVRLIKAASLGVSIFKRK